MRYPKNMARFPEVPSSILPDETGEMTSGKTHHRDIYLWAEGPWHRQTEAHSEAAWKQVLNLYKGIHTRPVHSQEVPPFKPPNRNHRTCPLWGQKSTLFSVSSHSLTLGTLLLLSAWPFFPLKCEVGREHGGNSNSLLLSCQVRSWRVSTGTLSPQQQLQYFLMGSVSLHIPVSTEERGRNTSGNTQDFLEVLRVDQKVVPSTCEEASCTEGGHGPPLPLALTEETIW